MVFVGFRVVDPDRGHAVLVRPVVGQPHGVVGPAGGRTLGIGVRHHVPSLSGLDVDDVDVAGLSGVQELLGVGAPFGGVLERCSVGGQLSAFPLAVRLHHVELVFIAFIAEVRDPSAVGAPHRIPLRHAGGVRHVPGHAVLARQRPDLSTGFDRDALALRGHCEVADRVVGLDPAVPHRGAVAGNGDLDDPGRSRGDIQDHQVRPVLEDDLASAIESGADRGPEHVELLEVRHLDPGVGGEVVLPDVHSVVRPGVRQVVQRVAVPHRLGIGPFPIRDLHRIQPFQIHDPEVGCHAAPVAFPRSAVAGVGGVGEERPVAVNGAGGTVRDRQFGGQAAVGTDGVELLILSEPLVVVACEQE